MSAIAAAGLAPSRSNLPHHCCSAEVTGHLRGDVGQDGAAAPLRVDVVDQLLEPLVGRDPVNEPCEATVNDKGVGSLRVAGSEQRGQRATLGDAELDGSLDPDCVHDGADVVHPLVHRRQVRDVIGKPSASLVEEHDAAEAAEPVQPSREARLIPVVLDVGDVAWRHDEVRAFAEHLIGYVYVTALGIVRGGLHAECLP